MYGYNDYSNETSQNQNSYDYGRYQAPQQSYYQPQYNPGLRNRNDFGLLKLIALVVLGVIIVNILLHSWIFWTLAILAIVFYTHNRRNRFHGRY